MTTKLGAASLIVKLVDVKLFLPSPKNEPVNEPDIDCDAVTSFTFNEELINTEPVNC